MEEIVIYEKPTCSKCRVAIQLLDASGRPFRRVRYHDDRLSKAKLKSLVTKLGLPVRQIVRTKEPLYKELDIDVSNMGDDEVIALLAANPELLERPILEYGDRAVLGRPTENVAMFLKELSHT